METKSLLELTHEVKVLRSFHPCLLPNYDLVIFDNDYTGNVYLLPCKSSLHFAMSTLPSWTKLNIYYERNSKRYCIIRDMARTI